MSSPARLLFVAVLFFYSTVSAQEFPYSRGEPCPVEELFPEARAMALRVPAAHSNSVVSYSETRIHNRGTSVRRKSDFSERTIPIVFLNLSSCELVQSTITRRIENGRVPTILSTDDGRFIVYIEPRPYGTLWNWWNTPLQVLMPEQWIVAAIHWKRHPSGESVVYTPGSADLMNVFPTLAELGRYHIRSDISSAYEILSDVRSRAITGMTVPSVMQTFFPRLIESIISIEHADDHEVATYRSGAYNVNPIERPFAIIGANPEKAYSVTQSSAGARGLMQVMPETCKHIRQIYSPRIPVNCYDEPHGHPVELASAMLVIDYHLSILVQRLRRPDESLEAFATRPEMKLLLRAAYNTGPGRVSKAVKTKKDWSTALLAETRGYLVKAFGLD